MPAPVRLATIQSNRTPSCAGLKTDPLQEGFTMPDLFAAIERHLAWYDDLLAQAARSQAVLAVLTEDFTRLSSCMTYLDDPGIFHGAVDHQTPLVPERLGAAARRHAMHIVASYYVREGEAIYNVADLFGPQGQLVGRYRKVHMPQYERWLVTAGTTFPAFETELGWVGMLICYDQVWPEAAACCALNGAQILCQPSAASLTDYHMKTRAVDNQVHHISSTWRNSMIVSPRAQVLADAEKNDPAVVCADAEVHDATRGDTAYWEYVYSGILDHKERHLKFRRPEACGVLSSPHPPLARQYPEGGVAATPEAIGEAYRRHREARLKELRGESGPYHWRL
jgi:predicted amidohydrolase